MEEQVARVPAYIVNVALTIEARGTFEVRGGSIINAQQSAMEAMRSLAPSLPDGLEWKISHVDAERMGLVLPFDDGFATKMLQYSDDREDKEGDGS